MWHAQNRSVNANSCDLISATHFHLSQGVRGSIWVGDDSFYETDQSGPFVWGVIMVRTQSAIWESETSIHDRTNQISWRSLYTQSRGTILMLRWRSDGRDLTLTIWLFRFYRDHWSHQGEDLTVMPNFKILEILSLWWEMYSWMFWAIKLFRHLNPWLSWFLPLQY